MMDDSENDERGYQSPSDSYVAKTDKKSSGKAKRKHKSRKVEKDKTRESDESSETKKARVEQVKAAELLSKKGFVLNPHMTVGDIEKMMEALDTVKKGAPGGMNIVHGANTKLVDKCPGLDFENVEVPTAKDGKNAKSTLPTGDKGTKGQGTASVSTGSATVAGFEPSQSDFRQTKKNYQPPDSAVTITGKSKGYQGYSARLVAKRIEKRWDALKPEQRYETRVAKPSVTQSLASLTPWYRSEDPDWQPDSTHLEPDQKERFDERWAAVKPYKEGRGHTGYPDLLSDVTVRSSDLPYEEFTDDNVAALMQAFAEADFKCPVDGCEVEHESLLHPVARCETHTAPRDEEDNFFGIGVMDGLGVKDPIQVQVEQDLILTHWQAYHMRRGNCIVLPCLAYHTKCTGAKGAEHVFFGTTAAKKHLLDIHGGDDYAKEVSKRDDVTGKITYVTAAQIEVERALEKWGIGQRAQLVITKLQPRVHKKLLRGFFNPKHGYSWAELVDLALEIGAQTNHLVTNFKLGSIRRTPFTEPQKRAMKCWDISPKKAFGCPFVNTPAGKKDFWNFDTAVVKLYTLADEHTETSASENVDDGVFVKPTHPAPKSKEENERAKQRNQRNTGNYDHDRSSSRGRSKQTKKADLGQKDQHRSRSGIRSRSRSTDSRRHSTRLDAKPTLKVALKKAKKEKKPRKIPKWRSESPAPRLDKLDLTTEVGIREMNYNIRSCYHYCMCFESGKIVENYTVQEMCNVIWCLWISCTNRLRSHAHKFIVEPVTRKVKRRELMAEERNFLPLKLAEVLKYMFDRNGSTVKRRNTIFSTEDHSKSVSMHTEISKLHVVPSREYLYDRLLWVVRMIGDPKYAHQQYRKEIDEDLNEQIPLDIPESNCKRVYQPRIAGLDDYALFPVPLRRRISEADLNEIAEKNMEVGLLSDHYYSGDSSTGSEKSEGEVDDSQSDAPVYDSVDEHRLKVPASESTVKDSVDALSGTESDETTLSQNNTGEGISPLNRNQPGEVEMSDETDRNQQSIAPLPPPATLKSKPQTRAISTSKEMKSAAKQMEEVLSVIRSRMSEGDGTNTSLLLALTTEYEQCHSKMKMIETDWQDKEQAVEELQALNSQMAERAELECKRNFRVEFEETQEQLNRTGSELQASQQKVAELQKQLHEMTKKLAQTQSSNAEALNAVGGKVKRQIANVTTLDIVAGKVDKETTEAMKLNKNFETLRGEIRELKDEKIRLVQIAEKAEQDRSARKSNVVYADNVTVEAAVDNGILELMWDPNIRPGDYGKGLTEANSRTNIGFKCKQLAKQFGFETTETQDGGVSKVNVQNADATIHMLRRWMFEIIELMLHVLDMSHAKYGIHAKEPMNIVALRHHQLLARAKLRTVREGKVVQKFIPHTSSATTATAHADGKMEELLVVPDPQGDIHTSVNEVLKVVQEKLAKVEKQLIDNQADTTKNMQEQLNTVLQAVRAQKVAEVKTCDSNNNAPLPDLHGARDPLLATTPVALSSTETIWDISNSSTSQSSTRPSRTDGGVSASNGSVCGVDGGSVMSTENKGVPTGGSDVEMEVQEKVAHDVDEQQRNPKKIDSDNDSSSEEDELSESEAGTDKEEKEDTLRKVELGATLLKLDKFVSNVEVDQEMSEKLERECAIVVETEETLNEGERRTRRFQVVDQTLVKLTDLQRKERMAEEEYDSVNVNKYNLERVKLERDLCGTYMTEVEQRYERNLLQTKTLGVNEFPIDVEQVRQWLTLNPQAKESDPVLITPLGQAEGQTIEESSSIPLNAEGKPMLPATIPRARSESSNDGGSEASDEEEENVKENEAIAAVKESTSSIPLVESEDSDL